MGISRLSKNLEPYAVPTILGCKALGCEKHHKGQPSRIVIDGPSFAYCIYHRLVVEKPEWLTAVESIASYHELRNGALAFLDELESYGVVIEKIYFDGFLPTCKRSTRIKRLKYTHKKLFEYRQRHIDAKGVSICEKEKRWDELSLPTSVLTPGSPTPPTFRGIPPAAFIVPAILDAVYGSKYAAVCDVVPGEAEVYCAAAAKESGAIVLSNDSDLFVHDLGSHGAFVFLSTADLRANNDSEEEVPKGSCQTFKLSMFRPRDIAERLGLDNLQDLAFEYQKINWQSTTLPEALQSAREHQDRSRSGFEKFLKGYITEPSVSESQQFSPESLARLSSHGKLLDPRTSEVICQLESKDPQIVHAYLLCLIEDPARSSAWHVSSSHRNFAYSIPTSNSGPPPSPPLIIEHTRRGAAFVPQEIPLLPPSDLITYASHLHTQLTHHTTHLTPNLPTPLPWHLYALSQTYIWYLTTNQPPPSRDALARAITGAYDPHPTWTDIHLSAQIHAVLYSLRMIKQILGYVASYTSLHKVLRDLATVLEDLPDIAELMPSNGELVVQTRDVDVDDVLNDLAALLQKEAAGSPSSPCAEQEREREREREPGPGNESNDDDDVEDAREEGSKVADAPRKKKRTRTTKRKKKKDGGKGLPVQQGLDRGKPDNMFEMLFCS
ncbi:XPG domain containing-domain-containing protein [Usnea florida]